MGGGVGYLDGAFLGGHFRCLKSVSESVPSAIRQKNE